MGTKRKPSINWNIYGSSKQGCGINIKRKAEKNKKQPGQRKDALKKLLEWTEVLITSTDRGGAVVFWETNDCISEAN